MTSEAEPRVLTEDVRAILIQEIRGSDEEEGDSVALLAEKADTSTRTIYRILGRKTKAVSLDLADKLLIAAGRQLNECRVIWPDGTIEGDPPR